LSFTLARSVYLWDVKVPRDAGVTPRNCEETAPTYLQIEREKGSLQAVIKAQCVYILNTSVLSQFR